MIEKVNPCHPDKIADRIAGALVDLAYRQTDNPRIAVEVLIGHGICHIIAETSVHLDVEDVGGAVELCCGIGDDFIDGRPYSEIVEKAKQYIDNIGGFEKFAEWGLF